MRRAVTTIETHRHAGPCRPGFFVRERNLDSSCAKRIRFFVYQRNPIRRARRESGSTRGDVERGGDPIFGDADRVEKTGLTFCYLMLGLISGSCTRTRRNRERISILRWDFAKPQAAGDLLYLSLFLAIRAVPSAFSVVYDVSSAESTWRALRIASPHAQRAP